MAELHGIVECTTSALASALTANEFAVNCFRLLNSLTGSGLVERIAFFSGSNASGAGDDYHDTGNAFGENGFAVYRFNITNSLGNPFEWYLLFQQGRSGGNVNAGNAAPTIVADGGFSTWNMLFAASCAIGVSSSGVAFNPWTGTTNNDGNDSKGTPVWGTGSNDGYVAVLPRVNDVGGSGETNKEYVHMINFQRTAAAGNSNTTSRYHMFYSSQPSGITFVYDSTQNGLYNIDYIGEYAVRTDLTGTIPCGLVMFTENAGGVFDGGQTAGLLGGDNENGKGGGVFGLDISGSKVQARTLVHGGRYGNFQTDANFHPNLLTGKFDTFSIPVASTEASAQGFLGFLKSDIYQELFNADSEEVTTGFTRAVFGDSATRATTKIVVPWTGNSGVLPGTGTSRTGALF